MKKIKFVLPRPTNGGPLTDVEKRLEDFSFTFILDTGAPVKSFLGTPEVLFSHSSIFFLWFSEPSSLTLYVGFFDFLSFMFLRNFLEKKSFQKNLYL